MPQPSPESLVPRVTDNLAGPQNIILFILIIAVFIIAYKVLKLILETGLMSFLSIIYLFVLRYFGIGPEPTISNIILFAFLGGFLYLLYYFIASSIALLMIPVKTIGKTLKLVERSARKLLANKQPRNYGKERREEKKKASKRKKESESKQKEEEQEAESEGEEKKASEVVLERMKKGKREEDN